MVLLSVVICTYNNAHSLKLTIEQLVPQLSNDEVELIIVNNNSSDNTDKVVNHILDSGAPIKYLIQPLQGLSHARNLGVGHAQGDYVLFTDDDAEIKSDWIATYLKKIKEYKADCLFGRIVVIWDKPQPWWYDDRYQGFFAVVNHGEESFQVEDHRYPFFGKNFCVKKTIIDELGGFDPKFGRKGDILLGGEETAVFDYLINRKKLIWYFSDLDVGHRLKEREYTEENIKKQHFACAKPIVWLTNAQAKDLWFGRSKRLLRNHIVYLIESSYGYLAALVSGEKRERFFRFLEIRRAIMVIWLWIKGI